MEPEIASSGVGHKEKRKRLSLRKAANGESRGGSTSATTAISHLTPRGKALKLDRY